MSVPPVTESQLASAPSVDVPLPTTTTVAHTSSFGLTLPTSLQARDPELVAASEALCLLHEGPRTSQSSTMPEAIPVTQDVSLPPEEDYKVIIPSIGLGVGTRPFPILVNPNDGTLPLPSTPPDEFSGIRGTQFTSPVPDKPPSIPQKIVEQDIPVTSCFPLEFGFHHGLPQQIQINPTRPTLNPLH